MESSGKLILAEYLKTLPLDNSRESIIQRISDSETAVRDGTVSFRTVLPALMDTDLLLGTMLQWTKIRDFYMRDLRIYALSANKKVEKHMQMLVSGQNGIFLTALPIEFKEVFYEL